ncbi:MAG: hypothetical protein V2J24_20150 [Pseudomonadales bacterium]|jgi:hypothetical protein|nr:hypothetical protein [Pseudomonadales bacterium]
MQKPNLKRYRKLIVVLVGAVGTLLGPAALGITPGDQFGGVGQEAVVQAVLLILTAAGVFQAPNDP